MFENKNSFKPKQKKYKQIIPMEVMVYVVHSFKTNVLLLSVKPVIQFCATLTRLAEVGRLGDIKEQGNYKPGQLFLHGVFGYRGAVLFPWIARVFDRDLAAKKKEESVMGSDNMDWTSNVFYQVLVDSRDWPFIRAHAEGVTYLKKEGSSRGLYAIPGLDYVAHEDVMPYTSIEKQPIHHELFDKFFSYSAGQEPLFRTQEALKVWQKKNHEWLELSDVYKETTENIRVTVIPFYMGRSTHNNSTLYWWRYMIRLENFGTLTVTLRERHWRIFSLSGTLETVRGRGIVGLEPLLSKSLRAFQYSSHVSLQAPSGHMWGTFRLECEDAHSFDCRIPPFALESSSTDSSTPLDTL